MHDALHLLSGLTDDDITWILEAGDERQVIAGTPIITEGAVPEHLFLVLEGLVGIQVGALGSRIVARLGPGELLGEMSFLEERPASATVTAAENTLLLLLPRKRLTSKLADDSGFASRLYRSFARIAARRLREREAALGRLLEESAGTAVERSDRWERIAQALARLKAAVQEADKKALANAHRMPPEVEHDVVQAFLDFHVWVNGELAGGENEPAYVTEELGARLQRELLSYLLLTRTAERFYSKPRGYAGDYLTIEMIYENEAGGTGRVGPLIDRCFLETHAARAVRNRRGLLAEEIGRTIEHAANGVAAVTTLASGPAREVFDVYDRLADPGCLRAFLIDIDPEAIEFVRERSVAAGLDGPISLHLANLVYLATGREKLDLPPQDLVYSIGLIDYFNDKFVLNLMNYGYDLLKPGGRMILGNFHPTNPSKAFMDWVADWKLIHRDEDDLDRLYAASKFGAPCTRVLYEQQHINLFAECVR